MTSGARVVRADGGELDVAPPGTLKTLAQAPGAPRIRGGGDGQRIWLAAEHRGLIVQKVSSKADRSVAIELRFRRDAVSLTIDATGRVTVTRAGRSVQLATSDDYERLQQLLGGSEAVFATRILMAERELSSDLQAPEMSLLATAAFVASLSGDVDAPRRLATRFVEKHRGIYRQVRTFNCWDTYSGEVTSSWNDLQNCTNEANQDDSIFNRAYRRVACNGIWLLRSETAWVEYIGCMGLGQLAPG